ncbi:MAG: glycoside hydrolase family 18 protein [Pedobacter sp.]|nr:glycoside hydrolase family 18 protein [Pedobacter sp.]
MKRLIILHFLVVCMFGYTFAEDKPQNNKKIVVAYVTSWSKIMPDPNLITHINYAFGHINSSFNGLRIDNPERLKEIVALKTQSPSLKIQLSIGGWGSGGFSEMADDDNLRNLFAKDCKRVVDEFLLDGIDIDWEYPTADYAGIAANPDDTKNFTVLMRAIRKELGADKLLTLATIANARYINFAKIINDVDFVNIMAYDMASPPFHHAGLHTSKYTKEISVAEAVNLHLKAGVPPQKLVLGIPFYGRWGKEENSFIDYNKIIELKGYKQKWDKVAKAPYLVNEMGEFVCSFENERSIAEKCKFIKEKGLLGVMYWDYAGNDSQLTLSKAVAYGILLN